MRVIGLMSGTSYDGIDAAAADLVLDGETLVLTPLGTISSPYDVELKALLSSSLPPASITMEQVCRLDTGVGQAFAALAERADTELCDGRAELIASHGQTVFHWVDGDRVLGTLQLGQPAWIAERTGRPVVADFRPRDVAAGGQGAPLVSIVDVLWLRDRPGTPVALNLGGIANITVGTGEPVAFDTGPGNALIDAFVRFVTDAPYDADGVLASRGTVHQPLLDRLLAEPYYHQPPPKSTGKELFHLPYLHGFLADFELSVPDVVATLTALTAHTVADAVRSASGTEVIASGGGTRNPALMRLLGAALGDIPLHTSDALGLPSAAKESYAFAILGFLTAHALPATIPSCTGATHPTILGTLTPGHTGFPTPTAPTQPPTRLHIATG